MDKYQETFNTWDQVAQAYQNKFMELTLYNDTYDCILNFLAKDASILEIGCGPGNISKYLLSKQQTLKIKGFDVSEQMVSLAQKNNPLAEYEVMDCRNLDKLNAKYDAIICGFCIPYLSQKDLNKFIADCKSISSKAALLYISFVEGDYNKSGFLTGSSGNRVYFYYHSLENLEKLLKEYAFEKKAMFHIDYQVSDNSTEVHTVLMLQSRG